jgi:hypothetical protein
VARRVAFVGPHDPIERIDPANAPVEHVPNEPKRSASLEAAVDFSERRSGRKPVKRLGADHGVETGVGQGNGLGAPFEHGHAGRRAAKLGAHFRQGLDRRDACAGRDQARGELARAGAEIQRRLAGPKTERVPKPAADFGRILRTPDRIGGRCGRESFGGDGMQLGHGGLRSSHRDWRPEGRTRAERAATSGSARRPR